MGVLRGRRIGGVAHRLDSALDGAGFTRGRIGVDRRRRPRCDERRYCARNQPGEVSYPPAAAAPESASIGVRHGPLRPPSWHRSFHPAREGSGRWHAELRASRCLRRGHPVCRARGQSVHPRHIGRVNGDARRVAPAGYSKLARYAPGVVPTMRLNHRVRWACDENPQMYAMSASVSRPSAISVFARLMRRSVR